MASEEDVRKLINPVVLSVFNACHVSIYPMQSRRRRSRQARTHHSSFSPPVTASTTLRGAGPTPSTVWLPLAICVRPASAITSATIPRLRARAISTIISSSLLTCSAILAWPSCSQRRSAAFPVATDVL